MDKTDSEAKHRLMAPMPRRFPSMLPVRSVGYIPIKRTWIRRTFPRRFFSFILRGNGEYRRAGKVWPVVSPCVFTHGPGDYAEYGPSETWEELYLTYADEQAKTLLQRRLVPKDRPIWYVHHPVSFRDGVTRLLAAIDHVNTLGAADRIDRLCESLIMESLISEAAPPETETTQAIESVRAWLEVNYRAPADFADLARERALSTATFRRHWRRLVGLPPARYVAVLRSREACRLLVETRMSVGQIARAVGYEDPLYFSRRFRQIIGETASAYRRAHG